MHKKHKNMEEHGKKILENKRIKEKNNKKLINPLVYNDSPRGSQTSSSPHLSLPTLLGFQPQFKYNNVYLDKYRCVYAHTSSTYV